MSLFSTNTAVSETRNGRSYHSLAVSAAAISISTSSAGLIYSASFPSCLVASLADKIRASVWISAGAHLRRSMCRGPETSADSF